MKILSIESSCDETAAAVTEGRKVLSNIVATQIAEHRIYGGVVPEIASRRHTEAVSAVCAEALEKAGLTYDGIDAVAVTFAPGLIGALLVGVNFAKGLALSLSRCLSASRLYPYITCAPISRRTILQIRSLSRRSSVCWCQAETRL